MFVAGLGDKAGEYPDVAVGVRHQGRDDRAWKAGGDGRQRLRCPLAVLVAREYGSVGRVVFPDYPDVVTAQHAHAEDPDRKARLAPLSAVEMPGADATENPDIARRDHGGRVHAAVAHPLAAPGPRSVPSQRELVPAGADVVRAEHPDVPGRAACHD